MKKKTKLMSLFIMLALCVIGLIPVAAAATTDASADSKVLYSGNCGGHATYTVTDDGTLTIFGTGTITNAWSQFREDYMDIDEMGNILDEGTHVTIVNRVIIPEGITEIYGYTFSGFINLTEISFPSTLTKIGDRAFKDCKALTSITIPKTVTKISGSHTFCGCTGLTEVVYDSSASIPKYSFLGCTSLQKITITGKIKSIGEWAFKGCSSLSDITIPESVKSIGADAFNGCSSLQKITIPNNVKSLSQGLFFDCTSLEEITMPNELQSIEHNAFGGCASLKEITIPDTVQSIDGYAFEGCASLKEISLPKEIKENDLFGTFENCSSLEYIEVPRNVKIIGMYTFKNCTSLKTVVLPGVTTIEYGAFDGCSALTDVYYAGNAESFSKIKTADHNDVLRNVKLHTYKDYNQIPCCNIFINYSKYRYTGKAVTPAVTVRTASGTKLRNGTHYTLRYENNVECGTANIIVTGIGKYVGTQKYTFEIALSKVTDINATMITDEKSTISWTASPYADKYNIYWAKGSTVYPYKICEVTDNCITFDFNEFTERDFWLYSKISPKYKFVIEPVKTYTDANGNTYDMCGMRRSVTVYRPNLPFCTVTTKYHTYGYTGKAITPTVTVTTPKGTKLKNGVNYTVSYKNNTECGTATITITGIGKYSGVITYRFGIRPSKVKDLKATEIVNGSSTITWSASPKAEKYYIYKDYVKVGETTSTSFKLNNINDTYRLSVRAIITGTDSKGKPVIHSSFDSYVTPLSISDMP